MTSYGMLAGFQRQRLLLIFLQLNIVHQIIKWIIEEKSFSYLLMYISMAVMCFAGNMFSVG